MSSCCRLLLFCSQKAWPADMTQLPWGGEGRVLSADVGHAGGISMCKYTPRGNLLGTSLVAQGGSWLISFSPSKSLIYALHYRTHFDTVGFGIAVELYNHHTVSLQQCTNLRGTLYTAVFTPICPNSPPCHLPSLPRNTGAGAEKGLAGLCNHALGQTKGSLAWIRLTDPQK